MRSVLAPRPFSAALAFGLAVALAIGITDLLAGTQVILAATLVVPMLAVALWGRVGDSVAMAVAGLFIVLVSAVLHAEGSASQAGISTLVVVAGGLATIGVGLVRTGAAVALERFALLMGVATIADEPHDSPEALVDALLGLLVPRFADVCSVDDLAGQAPARLGVRCGPGIAPEVAEAVARRRGLPADDERSTASAARREQGILVTDFDDALPEALEGRPGDAALLRRLALASGLTLPLRARGRVFGTLACGLGPSGRRYSEADLRFGEVLAGRVALALDNAGLTRELSQAEAQLGTVLSSLAEAVTVVDRDERTIYANDAAIELLRVEDADDVLGAEAGALMARYAVYDEAGRPISLQDLPGTRALAGEEDVGPMLVRNVVRATGEDRWLVNKTTVMRDDAGRLMGVVNVIEDVTEVKRAERAQRLLASASEALASTVDFDAALEKLTQVAVGEFADWAAIDMPARGQQVERVAVAHRDPARLELLREVRERTMMAADDEVGQPAVIRHSRPVLLREVPDELLDSLAVDESHRRQLDELGIASAMMVPLQAGPETLGTLTLVSSDPMRRFGERDLELATELGRRAGLAVLNARQYGRRTAIAQAFQRGLLPPELPEIPGWETAVLYRPAGELNEVGGDFYDVFEGPEGWMLVIGDIAGQGAEAATRTSLARFTARTAAELTGDVALAVGHLNATLRAQGGLPLCTLVCAALEQLPDGCAKLTLAVAGHPPPLLVRGSEVQPLGRSGTIAGAFDREEWTATSVELVPGDVLVFYTDGVLDAVGESDRFGEARLHELLARLDGGVSERLAALDDAIVSFQHGAQRDDTTVLVLEYRGTGPAGDAAALTAREAA